MRSKREMKFQFRWTCPEDDCGFRIATDSDTRERELRATHVEWHTEKRTYKAPQRGFRMTLNTRITGVPPTDTVIVHLIKNDYSGTVCGAFYVAPSNRSHITNKLCEICFHESMKIKEN